MGPETILLVGFALPELPHFLLSCRSGLVFQQLNSIQLVFWNVCFVLSDLPSGFLSFKRWDCKNAVGRKVFSHRKKECLCLAEGPEVLVFRDVYNVY